MHERDFAKVALFSQIPEKSYNHELNLSSSYKLAFKITNQKIIWRVIYYISEYHLLQL